MRRELIAEMAAVHAFSVIKNSDRVGLIIFTDRVEHFVPPKKGRTHVLRVIRDILEFQARRETARGTGIPAAVRYLMNITKKTSVAFLMSDFFATEVELAALKTSLSIASQRHDFVAYITRDQADEKMTPAGLVALEDLETGGVRLVDTSSAGVRRAFEQRAFADRAQVESLLKRLSIDYEVLWTGQDYIPTVNHLFQRRARRY